MGRERFRQQAAGSIFTECRVSAWCRACGLQLLRLGVRQLVGKHIPQGRPVLVGRPAVPGMRRCSSFPREVHPTGTQQLLSPEVAEMLREEIEPEETSQETERRILQKEKTLRVIPG